MAEAIGIVASIAALAQLTGKVATLTYQYLGAVKQSQKDLQELADELHTLDQILITLQTYASGGAQSTSLVQPLRMCTAELRGLQSKLEKKKSLRGLFGRLKWPLEEDETYEVIARISRHKSSLILAISSDQISLSKEINETVKSTNVAARAIQAESVTLSQDIKNYAQTTNLAVQDINAQVENTDRTVISLQAAAITQQLETQRNEMRLAEEERDRVLHWIYPSPTDKRHIAICSRRQNNTGKWLLESQKFTDWSGGSTDTLLWGYGIPGAGKTYITSTVIDVLHGQSKAKGYGVAYVYFDFNEQDQQTPVDVLASLTKQLASQATQLPVEVTNLYGYLKPRGQMPTFEELFNTLLATVKSFPRVYVALDALDECHQENQRRKLLPLFHRMIACGIRIFLTSRQYPEDIQRYLSTGPSVEISAHEDDLKCYVAAKIDENPRAKHLVQLAKCRDLIISQLVECAKGMFLLVRLHIEHLCQQTTPRQILKELDQLKRPPMGDRSLDHTYDRIIERIQNQSKSCAELALKILSWILKARRPLTLVEIKAAVAVEPNRYESDILDFPATETLVDVCAGLVVVDDGRSAEKTFDLFGRRMCSATIRFSHYSVQEYLERTFIDSEGAQLELTVACITYLSFDAFAAGPCESDESLVSRLWDNPLLDYAIHNVFYHLRACPETLSLDLFLKFLSCPGSVESYVQTRAYRKDLEREYIQEDCTQFDCYDKGRLPLHLASAAGHSLAVQKLLESNADPLAQDDDGMTPLHWAAQEGQEEVARMLLGNGAQIEARTRRSQNALHLACISGHEAVVRLLVPRMDVSNPRPYLQLASVRGRIAVVLFLLNVGVNTDSSAANRRQEAIYWAASEGHHEVVRSLLEMEIDPPNLRQHSYLHLAVSTRVEVATDGVQRKTPNIATFSTGGQNALHVAAANGDITMVRLLLENGADTSVKDDLGQSALHLSASGGQDPQLALLYASIRSIAKNRSSVFRYADHDQKPEPVHQDVAMLLVEEGADFLSEDNEGQTALHRAAYIGYDMFVELLLGRGADVSLQDKNGKTALHQAAVDGSERTVQLLLEAGADITITEKNGQTALHIAAAKGRADLVKILLENGADLATVDDTQETALQKAAAGLASFPPCMRGEFQEPIKDGHPLTIQLLIERGADFSFTNQDGRSILHCAAAGGHPVLVRWLLSKGAGCMTRDSEGKTVLQIASSTGHWEVIKELFGFFNRSQIDLSNPEIYQNAKEDYSFVEEKIEQLQLLEDHEEREGIYHYERVNLLLKGLLDWYERMFGARVDEVTE